MSWDEILTSLAFIPQEVYYLPLDEMKTSLNLILYKQGFDYEGNLAEAVLLSSSLPTCLFERERERKRLEKFCRKRCVFIIFFIMKF